MTKTFTDPRALAADLRKFVGQAAGHVMTSVAGKVIEATPVDTTHAKTNWVPAIGTPHDGVVGTKEQPDAGEQSFGLALLGVYQIEAGDIYITNDVDYLPHLDAGYSAQAEPNFVDHAIRDGIASSGGQIAGGE